MKTYWDSSALIKLLHEPVLRLQLGSKRHATRTHALAEIFSTLTKGVSFRYSPQDASRIIADLAKDLTLIQINPAETLAVINDASTLGVRAARVHDLLHSVAARKFEATILMTLDTSGFKGLTNAEIRSP